MKAYAARHRSGSRDCRARPFSTSFFFPHRSAEPGATQSERPSCSNIIPCTSYYTLCVSARWMRITNIIYMYICTATEHVLPVQCNNIYCSIRCRWRSVWAPLRGDFSTITSRIMSIRTAAVSDASARQLTFVRAWSHIIILCIY